MSHDARSPDWLRAAAINALAAVASPAARAAVLRAIRDDHESALVLTALAEALEPLAAPEAVPQIAVQMERLPFAVERAQLAVSLAAALGDREMVYSALAQPSMGREAAAARMFDQLQRRAGSPPSRQAVRVSRKAWEESDLARSLHALLRALGKTVPARPDAAACRETVAALTQAADRRSAVTQEGFILCLSAALRAMDRAHRPRP